MFSYSCGINKGKFITTLMSIDDVIESVVVPGILVTIETSFLIYN